MSKIILVNPAMSPAGYSVITPRWLFVIAQATPVDLTGDPILIDESIQAFDETVVEPGDVVGIGISTGNCLAGYTSLKKAKSKGALVIMGGIHATIFPEECLEMGADAVVTGNGDVVWKQVVKDALHGTLRQKYDGGRVPGEALSKARWDLLDPRHYMFPTVQTVAGCPENCSFCSVWITDGRHPRQRPAEKVIEEVNELYRLGIRYIIFADDNFNPATLGRIAREPSAAKRRELEHIREERLRFFDRYDRSVPGNMHAFTQMTAEAAGDPEYLSMMYRKMRIRAALVGIESFSEEGLKGANKQWSPSGEKMIEAVQTIQASGIIVLSSFICGLEADTVQTIRRMSRFALETGTLLAQFTIYHPYPGTRDFYEMVRDQENRGRPGFVPKHRIQLSDNRFWLKQRNEADLVLHPNLPRDELIAENRKCWESFYSLPQVLGRIARQRMCWWTPVAKFVYLLFCVAFRQIYAGQGMAADGFDRKRIGIVTRSIIKIGVFIYNRHYRKLLGTRVGDFWLKPAGSKRAGKYVHSLPREGLPSVGKHPGSATTSMKL